MHRSPMRIMYALRLRARTWWSKRKAARQRIVLPSPTQAAELAHRDIVEITRAVSHLGLNAIMVSALRSRTTTALDVAVCALTKGEHTTVSVSQALRSQEGRDRLARSLSMHDLKELHRIATVVDDRVDVEHYPASASRVSSAEVSGDAVVDPPGDNTSEGTDGGTGDLATDVIACMTSRLDARGVRRSFDDHYVERAIAQRLIRAGAYRHAHAIVKRWKLPSPHQRQVLADFYNPVAHDHPWVNWQAWAEHRDALWTDGGLEPPAIAPEAGRPESAAEHSAPADGNGQRRAAELRTPGDGTLFDRLTSQASVAGTTAMLAGDDARTSTDARTTTAPTTSAAARTDSDSPSVTVIMTTFRPGADLITGVRSVLQQTFQHFDILIMDDASGPECDSVLDSVEQMDSRIRVIRADANAGTYVRRNDALALATGTYVTVHDSDDWMHPRRLELQVAYLEEHPDAPASISQAYRMSEQLEFIQDRGMKLRPCEPALMWRRVWGETHIGFYDAVRKSADGEIRRRIEVASGQPVPTVMPDVALTIQRTQSTSLSGSEFGDNWQHEARLAYRSAYMQWHRTLASATTEPSATSPADVASTYLPASVRQRPFPAPHRLGGGDEPTELDVLLVGDFAVRRGESPDWADVLEWLKQAGADGRTVGLFQVWTPAAEPRMPPHLHPSVQELINSGAVAHVVGDSPISVGQIVAVDHVALAFAPETLRDVRPSSVKALGESRLADSGAARRLASTTVHRLWGLALAD